MVHRVKKSFYRKKLKSAARDETGRREKLEHDEENAGPTLRLEESWKTRKGLSQKGAGKMRGAGWKPGGNKTGLILVLSDQLITTASWGNRNKTERKRFYKK